MLLRTRRPQPLSAGDDETPALAPQSRMSSVEDDEIFRPAPQSLSDSDGEVQLGRLPIAPTSTALDATLKLFTPKQKKPHVCNSRMISIICLNII